MAENKQSNIRNMIRNFIALLIGLSFCFVLLLIADRVFWAMAEKTQPRHKREPNMYRVGLVENDNLGYAVVPNLDITTTKTTLGEKIYTARYTTDSFGRRSVPDSKNTDEAEKFIAFFGCSFTFGEGVNDEETLPNQVALQLPDYAVYNYAAPGYGPQQMLVMLESDMVSGSIPKKKGILVYSIIHDHISRAAGRMQVTTRNARHFPYYKLINDDLVRIGNFDTHRPMFTVVSSLLSKSGVLRYFWIDFPPLTQYHYKLTTEILLESRRSFQKQFEEIVSIVMIYPTVPYHNKDLSPVVTFLEREGVVVLDCHDWPFDRSIHALHMQHDFHPSPLLHQLMAAHLAAQIKESDYANE